MNSKVKNTFALAVGFLLSVSCSAGEDWQLKCDDMPLITLDGNRYLSKGKGETLTVAIEQAQQQLSQMLNTRVSASCLDIEHSGASQRDPRADTGKTQNCSVKSFSSNRFGHTPVLAVRQCEYGVIALISLDQRLLVKRLQTAFPQLSEIFGGLAIQEKLPFPVLVRLLKEGRIRLEFDERQRLWSFQTDDKQLFVSQNVLWNGLHWEGCINESEFQLESWYEAIRSSRQGSAIELSLKSNIHHQAVSLFELNEYGGIEVIAENSLLNDSNKLKNWQIVGNPIAGEVRSSFVYLLSLSGGNQKAYPLDSTLSPGGAFSALLSYLVKKTEAELCAWPMDIYK